MKYTTEWYDQDGNVIATPETSDELEQALYIMSLCEFNFEEIDQLIDSASSFFKENINENNSIQHKIIENEKWEDSLIRKYQAEMEVENLNSSLKLLYELAILALHKNIEQMVTKLLIEVFLFNEKVNIRVETDENKRKTLIAELNKKKMKFHYYAEIEKILYKNGVDVKDTIGSYNELRLLSNAIKHEGRITDQLKEISHWSNIDEISTEKLIESFERLKNEILFFSNSLCKQIQPLLKNKAN